MYPYCIFSIWEIFLLFFFFFLVIKPLDVSLITMPFLLLWSSPSHDHLQKPHWKFQKGQRTLKVSCLTSILVSTTFSFLFPFGICWIHPIIFQQVPNSMWPIINSHLLWHGGFNVKHWSANFMVYKMSCSKTCLEWEKTRTFGRNKWYYKVILYNVQGISQKDKKKKKRKRRSNEG